MIYFLIKNFKWNPKWICSSKFTIAYFTIAEYMHLKYGSYFIWVSSGPKSNMLGAKGKPILENTIKHSHDIASVKLEENLNNWHGGFFMQTSRSVINQESLKPFKLYIILWVWCCSKEQYKHLKRTELFWHLFEINVTTEDEWFMS